MVIKNKISNKLSNSLLIINNFLYAIIFLALLLITVICKTKNLNAFFNINLANENWKFSSIKASLLVLLVFKISIALINILIVLVKKWNIAIVNNVPISILLAVLNFNLVFFTYVLLIFYKKPKNADSLSDKWKNIKNNIGIKHWATKNYILIAIFCSLTITLAFMEENFLPHLPFGGGIGLKYISLIIISYATNFISGWITGFTTAIMSLIFIPVSNIVSPWSFILDYFLPLTTPALVALLPKINTLSRNIFNYINYFIHCFLVMLIICFWQVLSGYFIWTKLFPSSIWNGYQPFLYSLVYNFIHTFIFTYPLLQILIPPLYRTVILINK